MSKRLEQAERHMNRYDDPSFISMLAEEQEELLGEWCKAMRLNPSNLTLTTRGLLERTEDLIE